VGGQLGNIAFVIWRESVEALLVIGILNAWLVRQQDIARRGQVFLWAGVVAGLLLAVALGAALLLFGDSLEDDAQQAYQTGAMLVAAALIVQMVFWMRKHGRTLKRELETSLQEAADRSNWWGVFVLALIAVAREGSETVVFLYGTLPPRPTRPRRWRGRCWRPRSDSGSRSPPIISCRSAAGCSRGGCSSASPK
jgi:high-affinity iron transporter